MAIFSPTLEQIDILKVPPTAGERSLLKALETSLDNSYEVFFQPCLNGDNPDVIVMRKGVGVWILEVKDWNLDYYYVERIGVWGLKNHKGFVSSPVEQAREYKNNLYGLHIEGLLEKKINNRSYYSVIHFGVYFHNETESRASNFVNQERRKDQDYFDILGHDSLNEGSLRKILQKRRLDKPSVLFTDELYEKFLRYLSPSEHALENGESITYTKRQQELSVSRSGQQKVKGVAGAGKTLVLAKRAVNAHKRTGGNVLILTFNLTLVNYIHDQISRVREHFKWNTFTIINYHQFFKSQSNNYNLLVSSYTDYDNENFFEQVAAEIMKYDAIFIDEIQDFKLEWQKLVKNYFLQRGGEFVVFGDEKQNIYGRELEDRKIRTLISGKWNSLTETHRLSNKVCEIASAFQDRYLVTKYEKDELKPVQMLLDFDNGVDHQVHYYYAERCTLEHAEKLYSLLDGLSLHPNDIGFLAANYDILQKFDLYIRTFRNERTTTTFEEKEMNDKLKEEETDPNKLKMQLDEIRRSKKMSFWMNRGTSKLSTIHSFKGWEIRNLVLLLEPDTRVDEGGASIGIDELIYTGLTRCRKHLFLINFGNDGYHSFFMQNRQLFDRIENSW